MNAPAVDPRTLIRSRERVRDLAEVFTPTRIVRQMLDLVGDVTHLPEATFLEPSCGNGNFLVEILYRKLATVFARNRRPGDAERQVLRCVMSIYGVDIDATNVADIHRAQGSAIAGEAITRIAQLYAIEKEARGSPPDSRVQIRQVKAKPIFNHLEAWLHAQLPSISGKSPLAVAIRYALTRIRRLRPYLDHGILELDNNTAERAMRSIAIGRKNYLFVGSLTGGRAAAIAYTLIETAKLNGVDPQAWLADTLACIPDHKITRIDDLLPWHWRTDK